MAAQLKPGQGPLDYGSRTWLKVLFATIFFILYAPIITLIAFSFNTDKRGVVWRGFTLDNYAKAWNNASLIEALTNSLVIALIATVIATVLGALTALLMWRFRFPFKGAYEGFMALPIVIPEICMGVALLLFFVNSGMMEFFVHMPWPLNLGNIIFAHVTFCFPFVAVVVRSRLVGFNRQLEEASKDLGASEWQTFWSIIVPYMKPGLIAGALLAFTLSLDDFVITFFTAGAGVPTLPLTIYTMIKIAVTPEVNAVSTLLMLLTLTMIVLAGRIAPETLRAKD